MNMDDVVGREDKKVHVFVLKNLISLNGWIFFYSLATMNLNPHVCASTENMHHL